LPSLSEYYPFEVPSPSFSELDLNSVTLIAGGLFAASILGEIAVNFSFLCFYEIGMESGSTLTSLTALVATSPKVIYSTFGLYESILLKEDVEVISLRAIKLFMRSFS
jgi:hypothetical protein